MNTYFFLIYMDKPILLLRTITFIYYTFMILFVVGFFQTKPPIFITFTFVVKVSMALFLLYRFNYFNGVQPFTKLDREIVLFSAGFILVSSFTDYINLFIEKIQKIIHV